MLDLSYRRLYQSDIDSFKWFGCIKLLKAYPDPDIAFLGLLLFKNRYQNQGLGQHALKFICKLIQEWSAHTLRIAVVENNNRALNFWKKQDFQEMYRKKSEEFIQNVIVMEQFKHQIDDANE